MCFFLSLEKYKFYSSFSCTAFIVNVHCLKIWYSTLVVVVLVGFCQSPETVEFCAAEFSSVSASSGVAEETNAGVALSVALSAGEGGRRSVSVEPCLPS